MSIPLWHRVRHLSTPLRNLNPTVRAEMARRGETQSTLAPKIGLTQSGLSRRLTGDAEWTVHDLYKLADVLDVPLSTFLPEMQASA